MSKYYVPTDFAKEAVKKIRVLQVDYLNKGLDNNLLDSELEEVINNSFQQSICDNCETRILFDANERVSKELYNILENVVADCEILDYYSINQAKLLLNKYKNLKNGNKIIF